MNKGSEGDHGEGGVVIRDKESRRYDMTELACQVSPAVIADLGRIFGERMREGGGRFSEQINMDPAGHLAHEDETGQPHSLFAGLADEGPEHLYFLGFLVQDRFPNLVLSFERGYGGPDNTPWIRYTVSQKSAPTSK